MVLLSVLAWLDTLLQAEYAGADGSLEDHQQLEQALHMSLVLGADQSALLTGAFGAEERNCS